MCVLGILWGWMGEGERLCVLVSVVYGVAFTFLSCFRRGDLYYTVGMRRLPWGVGRGKIAATSC